MRSLKTVRVLAATVSVVALLVSASVASNGGAAVASVAAAPVEPKPDFGDPIPGRPDDRKAADGTPKSSRTAELPETAPLPTADQTEIVLPDSGQAGPRTRSVPGARGATITGEWKQIGDSGLSVAASEQGSKTVEAVQAELLTGRSAAKLHLSGLVLALSRADDSDASAPIGVKIPEALLHSQYGADYANRLQWVQVSGSAAGPEEAADAVAVAATFSDGAVVLTPKLSASRTFVTAMAGPTSSSGTGTYSATPLKSASTWDVAEQTGAFTWAYDMAAPTRRRAPPPALGCPTTRSRWMAKPVPRTTSRQQ